MNHHRQQQQIVRLPDPQQVGTLVVRQVTQLARHHKAVTGFYLLGWVFLLFVGSGTRLTLQQQATYNSIMKTIDVQAEYDATVSENVEQDYYAHTSDFWQELCLTFLFCNLLLGRLLASQTKLSSHQGLVYL